MTDRFRLTTWRWAGLAAGLAAFALIAFLDGPLHHLPGKGSRPAFAAATAALMAIWWLGESLPIYVTACVPLVVFPLTGVFGGTFAHDAGVTALPYVNDYILLFAGGMCIGAAMQQWGLDRRIALLIMRRVGTDPKRLLFGVLLATAFISMWISNTATAAMMVPIGLAVVRQMECRAGVGRLAHYGAAIMLSVAYAANIGGVGTKIGTAPNMQLCGLLANLDPPVQVSFGQFAAVGVPFVALMLPLAWWVLWRVGRRDAPAGSAGEETIREEIRLLGPVSSGERVVFGVFVGAAVLWILGKPLADGVGVKGSAVEGYVAVLAAVVLLASAAGGRRVLGWRTLRAVPWHTLLLLGGSFAMAAGIERSGLSEWLAAQLEGLREEDPFVQVLGASVATVGITAVASNTATVSVMLPLLRNAVSASHMLTVLFACTISASCDFALPAGTPPNAIVFGSGYVSIPRMAKTGVALDLVAAALAAVWALVAVPLVF